MTPLTIIPLECILLSVATSPTTEPAGGVSIVIHSGYPGIRTKIPGTQSEAKMEKTWRKKELNE